MIIFPLRLNVSLGFYDDPLPVVAIKIFVLKVFEKKIDKTKIDPKKKAPLFLIKAFSMKKMSIKYICGFEKLSQGFACVAFATIKTLLSTNEKTNFSLELTENRNEILIINITAATSILKLLTQLLSKKGIQYAKSIRPNTANS
ncbi:MAG TPA: hypothetical protein PK675_02630 [Clostridia bacterium]|nr:hypothetical protein [Clostridia bacterium]